MLRRLLMASGGGGSFASSATAAVFSLGQVGFWQPISDRRAWYFNGKTYIIWIDGVSGDEEVASYDHTTNALSTPFVLHAALGADLHNSGSILVMDDSKLIAHYAEHHATHPRRRVSTNAEDVSAWGTAAQIGSSSDVTYCSAFQLLGVTGDPIYLFYRITDGTHSYLVYRTTTDHGVSYSAPVTVWEIAGKHVYWRIGSDHDTRIDFTATNTDRTVADPSSLYHFYFNGAAGTWHKSDGTGVTLPLDTTEATLVKNTADGPIQPEGISYAGTNPVALMSVFDNAGTTNSVRQARWNGSAWSVVTVADTNGIVNGNRFVGSAAIDHADPDVVYIPRKVGSFFEMFRYVSIDSGATWNGTALTSGSAANNAMPEVPTHAASGLQAIWGLGTWTSDSNFDFTMYGYGT